MREKGMVTYKMKSKRILCTLLCVLMLVSMLAACSGQTDTTAGETNGPTGAPETTAPDGSTPETTTPDVEPPTPVVPPKGDDDEGLLVTVEDNAAVTVNTDTKLPSRLEEGTVVTFTIKVSPLYSGTAVVYAGEEELTADAEGVYSFTVTKDTQIRVKGLELIVSAMEGTGDSDDPYEVTSITDMLYIAERVNAGDSYYTAAFYELQNDLDFQGLEMSVIGDMSTSNGYFSGYFDGNGHTISNYRIETTSTEYVGLFGILYADLSGTGGGSVYDLHLKDFTMNVSASGSSCYVGAFAGYGMGANLILCSAEGGTINIYADDNYFAYAGGLMGIQEAITYDSYPFYSSISYCYTDLTMNCNSGVVYAAGGLVGYATAAEDGVVASINNSYVLGDMYGAVCSGGLIGYMDSGVSVVNSYTAGTVSAQCKTVDTVNFADYCKAYAGGLVAYAKPNSIIVDSFSAANVSAYAALGEKYQIVGSILGYAVEPDAYDFGYTETTVYNCIDTDGKLPTNEQLWETLHWNTLDWTVENGKYPVFNMENDDAIEDFFYTIKIVVDGKEYDFERNLYLTMSFWYSYEDGRLPRRMASENNANLVSYGYFFDEAHTLPVPDSYIPTHDVTLYAAMADMSKVAGEYEFVIEGSNKNLKLTINVDGTYSFDDAGDKITSICMYNGKGITFEDARFGRFYSGDVTLEHYQNYTFYAVVQEDGSLQTIGGKTSDGYIFTEEEPLVILPVKNALSGKYADGHGVYTFYADGTANYEDPETGLEKLNYTISGNTLTLTTDEKTITGTVENGVITVDGVALKALDAFAGSWTVNSKANKVYTFDGAGNWTYSYYGYKTSGLKIVFKTLSGTYTIDDDVLTMTGDLSGTAQFKDNLLIVTLGNDNYTCYQDGGFRGTWLNPDYSTTLYLKGITAEGYGIARIEYTYDSGIVEAYDLICALDEKDSTRLCLYYYADGITGEVFGYMSYVVGNDYLDATIYVGSMGTFMSNFPLYAVDDYEGLWIGDIAGMERLSFNGYGSYQIGLVTINGEEISYLLDDGTLEGAFTYNDVTYSIAYNEANGTVTLTWDNGSAVYCRKDAFGDVTLTDGNGKFYTFDGRSNLGNGIMYVNGVEAYTYTISNGELTLYKDGTQVGSVSIANAEYLLNAPDAENVTLRIQHKFTGTWAMSGSPEGNLVIGTMDLNGKLNGSVSGINVEFTLEEDGSLAFILPDYTTVFYFIPVGDEAVVDSYKDWYLYGTQIECARIDTLFGTWKNSLGGAYQFDGMSNGTLTNAMAQAGTMGTSGFQGTTAYGYTYNEEMGQYILWTVSSTTGETKIFRLNFCAVDYKRAYVNEDGTLAFTVEEGNALYNSYFVDEDTEITYYFDGFDKVTTSDGDTYTYKIVGSIDYTTKTATIKLTDEDGNTVNAVVDFSDTTDPTITFEEA